ncbi:MAG: hypothetical protein CSB47_09245 [Proteobacteria bacterium]|nr:MAG: hypothetical protein CSB47_09245 [Pseudomonadota bacterium]
MYRRILCLGLLGCFSQGVYAVDCDVDVSLKVVGGGSVEFNPFNVQPTNLTLTITHKSTNYTGVTVKFGLPLTVASSGSSSSLSGYPSYVIKNESNGTVFDSDDVTTSTFPNINASAGEISNSSAELKYALSVEPDSQPNKTDRALAPLSGGSVTLPVIVEGVDGSSTTCSLTKNVEMPVSVVGRYAVAFSDSEFSSATPNAGVLKAGSLSKTSFNEKSAGLHVWSNVPYEIEASSSNGYMLRTKEKEGGAEIDYGDDASAISDVNKLPYTLTINTKTPIAIGGTELGNVVKKNESNGTDGPTKVRGNTVDVVLRTKNVGKRAGIYSDTVTITISPKN